MSPSQPRSRLRLPIDTLSTGSSIIDVCQDQLGLLVSRSRGEEHLENGGQLLTSADGEAWGQKSRIGIQVQCAWQRGKAPPPQKKKWGLTRSSKELNSLWWWCWCDAKIAMQVHGHAKISITWSYLKIINFWLAF